MNNWFQGQMDYIFFFYGLAFIGLGVVSYILSKEVNQRLPWVWLALFGFTHGLSEWLDLVALAWPDGVWFAACRWAVMTASFLFLVEFGRLGLICRKGQGPGRWLLVILALGACLGALSGWSGLNATTRYAIGLVRGPMFRVGTLCRREAGRFPVPPLASGRWRQFVALRPGCWADRATGRVLASHGGKL